MAKVSNLTLQQLRVWRFFESGKLNKQIAFELGITEATVKAHVSAILRKFEVVSRLEAVEVARRETEHATSVPDNPEIDPGESAVA